MKHFRLWLLPLLWALVGGGYGWATYAVSNSFAAYRSPLPLAVLAASRLPTAMPGIPQTERVVLVILSGVGVHTLNDPLNPFAFRTLRRLVGEGAWGISTAVVPSGDAPTWAALFSGASPPVSGVVLDEATPTNLDNVLSRMAASGRPTQLIGSTSALAFRRALAPIAVVEAAPSSDRVGDLAAATLPARQADLSVVVIDLARRNQYRGSQLWERVDQQLGQVVSVLDPRRDTLIVTGDHGTLPSGQWGGSEARVTQTPLIVWGAAVVPGSLGLIKQLDLAPTMAYLLGTPLPTVNQGRPLVELFAVEPEVQARAVVASLDQRLYLTQRLDPYRSDSPAGYQEAHAALRAGDWTTAIAEADRAAAGLAAPPTARPLLGSEYLWGIGVPLLLLIVGRLLGRWGRRWGHALLLPSLGGELYLLAWSLLFFGLAGGSVSLGSIYRNLGGELASVSGYAALALAVAVLPLAWLATEDGPTQAMRNVNNLVLLLNILGGVLVVILGVRFLVHPALSAPTQWTGLVLILAQLAAIGLATPLVTVFAAAITEVLQRGR